MNVHTGPRSCCKIPMAICQPAPGGPTIRSAGTRTSSKKTSQNSASPVICLSGATVIPGVFMSTSRRLMPFRTAEEEAPVGHLGVARPHLLAVDHVCIALPFAAAAQAAEIGPSAGLREALTPPVLARE